MIKYSLRTFILGLIGLFTVNVPVDAQAAADENNVCCEENCQASLFWVRGEFIIWDVKSQPIPVPLLTKGSFSDAIPGAIGEPRTHIELGHENFDLTWQTGVRVTIGSWFNENQQMGLEASYLLSPDIKKDRFRDTSGLPGSDNFAVPIFDVTGIFGLNGIPGETVFLLAGPLDGEPGFFGHFRLEVSTRLEGAEFNGIARLYNWDCEDVHLDLLGGFRWFQLSEYLKFDGETNSVPQFTGPAAFFNFKDRFRTLNNLFACQFGLRLLYNFCQWHFEGTVKLGAGKMYQHARIHGSSRTSNGNVFFETLGTAGTKLEGGIFTQPTNIGTYDKKGKWAPLIETDLQIGYHFTDFLEVFVGYSFIWFDHVIRPGDLIDRKINTTETTLAEASRETVGVGTGPIPFGTSGPAPLPRGRKVPKARFKTTEFWAQGLNIGLNFTF